MPIPREKRHPIVSALVGLYRILVVPPLVLADITVGVVLMLLITLGTLPWTLYFSSSNWGLKSKDRRLTREFAETIQAQNRDVNALLRSMKRHGEVSETVKFYPHKAKRSLYCIPGWVVSSTAYRYPLLSEVFTRLEDWGWKREAVYDLFISVATTREMKEELQHVKARVCRGAIFAWLESILPDVDVFTNWTKAQPTIFKPNNTAQIIDVDVNGDAMWLLARGAIIRPRDEKTLKAIDRLDQTWGPMWKFVEKEKDLREPGYWQYVVL